MVRISTAISVGDASVDDVRALHFDLDRAVHVRDKLMRANADSARACPGTPRRPP